jgi:6-phosphogluconate dehydrogenase
MTKFTRIGIIGAGSMGGNMALLFSEHDLQVSMYDIKTESVDATVKMANENDKTRNKVTGYKDYAAFMKSFDNDKQQPRLLLLSITHGHPADEVLASTRQYLNKGDIILDGGNEWYLDTERRQKEMDELGVHFIGMGVSGGYQSARRGASLSPGGNKEVLDNSILPFLRTLCAKSEKGGECVTNIGPGGSGHYVKMVHNGIEQGMLSIVCEAWGILHALLGFSEDDIGYIFTNWTQNGELYNNFLLSIGGEICTRHYKGDDPSSGHVLDDIEDKVVQDSDNTEGTGVWSVQEAAKTHVPAPTIAAAHLLRVASANRPDRIEFDKLVQLEKPRLADEFKNKTHEFIENLRGAVYVSFLASFVQGCNLIATTSHAKKWHIKMSEVIRIWRAGCIVQSDYISDILQPLYLDNEKSNDEPLSNILLSKPVAADIEKYYAKLKRIVLIAIEYGANIPALSASLEYFKYVSSTNLPTTFMEAELDYFGAHAYDLKSEHAMNIKKGPHHYEWKKP